VQPFGIGLRVIQAEAESRARWGCLGEKKPSRVVKRRAQRLRCAAGLKPNRYKALGANADLDEFDRAAQMTDNDREREVLTDKAAQARRR